MSIHSSAALSLFKDLQTPAKNFSVFVPVNSAVIAKVTVFLRFAEIQVKWVTPDSATSDLSVYFYGRACRFQSLPDHQLAIARSCYL